MRTKLAIKRSLAAVAAAERLEQTTEAVANLRGAGNLRYHAGNVSCVEGPGECEGGGGPRTY